MKKYLADLLTLIRFILAITLIFMAFNQGDIATAFLVFIFGELTDAFDGTCANKWPFPKDKIPKYRKYAVKYDIFTDMLLIFSMLLFFTMRVSPIAGIIIFFGGGAIAFIVELIVYGKLMGHPDDFKPGSLSAHNFPLARIIVLARRKLYIATIVFVAVWTLYASSWSHEVKLIIAAIAAVIGIFLWFFLAQRRHNISRNAVKIEKKLTQKKQLLKSYWDYRGSMP